MGDKHSNKSKHGKKKLTTKEIKAQNHLKLMEGHKEKNSGNVVTGEFNYNKDKKAA